MSTNVTGYTEAKIGEKWYCIDFFQYDMAGRIRHIPCLEGQSMAYAALQWECDMDRISAPDDLSEQVREACTGKDGKLFGEGDPYWNPWHIVRGNWFESVDLTQPEYCGFFPRQAVADCLSNPGENDINEDEMLSAQDYHDLGEEEKKAYQYFEYTPSWGNRRILRDFKENVIARINTWNSEIAFCKEDMQVGLSDVRVLLIVG